MERLAACSSAGINDTHALRCLDEWCPPEDWFHLYYPSRRNMSAGLRALIEAMRV